jgi:hypothetical protein
MTDSEYIELMTERSNSGSVWGRIKDWTLQVLDHMDTGGFIYN